jgi:hypothetical protein
MFSVRCVITEFLNVYGGLVGKLKESFRFEDLGVNGF